MTEDEIVGWLHRLNEHEFVQTPGQESLVCSSPEGHKELDVTEQLNNIQLQTLKLNILPFCDDFTLSL